MMFEKEIESRIVGAVEALALPGLKVRGAWQDVPEGEVKDVEGSDSPAALFVAASPRQFETFGLPICSMEVQLALVVRIERCPTGAALETYARPILSLLQSWSLGLSCSEDCGFAVEPTADGEGFAPGGVQLSTGEGPSHDASSATWSVAFSFTLRGVAVAALTEGD